MLSIPIELEPIRWPQEASKCTIILDWIKRLWKLEKSERNSYPWSPFWICLINLPTFVWQVLNHTYEVHKLTLHKRQPKISQDQRSKTKKIKSSITYLHSTKYDWLQVNKCDKPWYICTYYYESIISKLYQHP